MPASAGPLVELLDEGECLRLISAGGVGRVGYTGRFGPTVLPVNYALFEETIVFRTGQHSPMGEDLRTGIEYAESRVAFEIDEITPATREGWSVLVQGSAHLVALPNADLSRAIHVPTWRKGEPAAALGGIRLAPRAPWQTGQRTAKAYHNGQRRNASPGSARRSTFPECLQFVLGGLGEDLEVGDCVAVGDHGDVELPGVG
jgi:nitroimidazol reductase NimA-like FMN-containing flavoprotein (pyridoxamine 5'-phosphate oxidase superfamily)